MFAQLSIPLKIPKIPIEKKLVQHSGSHDRNKFLHTDSLQDDNIAGIKLYSCGEIFDSEIIKQLPKKLIDAEIPSVYFMEVEKENKKANYLPPHIDRGRRCAINFYIECSGEITEFYDKNIKLMASFSANNNSAWILDVTKPHAVKFKTGNRRSGITLSFKHRSYEKIVSELKDYIQC